MSQAIVRDNIFLLHACILGIILSFLYDNIRIVRRVIKHNNFFVAMEDLFFWFICAIWVFLLMHAESDGQLRWFAVGGALMGMILYHKLISICYVKYVSLVLGKIVHFLIVRPFGFLYGRTKRMGRKVGNSAKRTKSLLRKKLKKKLTDTKKFIRIILCKR